MKTFLIILGIVLVLLLLFIIIVSIILSNMMAKPKTYSREEKIEQFRKKGYNLENIFKDNKKIEFIMNDGYVIHGDYYLNKDINKFVILVHGHTSNREGERLFQELFISLGYNVILYDQPNSGENKKCFYTMGHKEAIYLDQIIKNVKERFGQNIRIGLHGVSLGGATVLLETKYHQDLDFIICDCGYCDLKEVLRYLVGLKKVWPPLVLWSTNLVCKIRFGFNYKEASAKYILGKNKVPMLLIHGKEDKFISPLQSFHIDSLLTCYHELVLIDNAAHALSYEVDPKTYKEAVVNFLNNIKK